MPERFADRLQNEYLTRRQSNPRYSLRAFALFLGTHHATLSQIMRGIRPAPAKDLRLWFRKLGLTAEEAAVYIAASHLPQPQAAAREIQLRQWTEESLDLMRDQSHWRILQLSCEPDFQHDSRWIANRIGTTADRVNVAFTRLLRLGMLRTDSEGRWTPATALPRTEESFRCDALRRIRQNLCQTQ